jgi:uncharacterized membrane protein
MENNKNKWYTSPFSWLLNLYPVYLGIVIVLILSYFKIIPEQLKIERFDTLITSIITVCITSIGFFFTIMTILIALFERKVMKFLMKHNGHELLTQYFLVPILAGGILILYCLFLGTIIGSSSLLPKTNFCILIALGITFIIGVGRIGLSLILILRHMGHELKPLKVEADTATEVRPEHLFQPEDD